MTGGDIRQEARDNMVNISTSSKSTSSYIGKQYQYKRSIRIPKNHALSGKDQRTEFYRCWGQDQRTEFYH